LNELEPETEPSKADRQFQEALSAVESTLDKLRRCSDEEKTRLRADITQMGEMYRKLTSGRVEIVVFGEISTGKSALINALVGKAINAVDIQGGWTKQVWGTKWEGCGYRMHSLDDSEIVLIDTPGINEVGGDDRAKMAREAAQKADLILFVTDSDLNDTEFSAILNIASMQKPIIVVLNKLDLYSPEQRRRLLEVVRDERLAEIVPPDLVVTSSADPREVEYVIESPDGKTRSEWRKPEPQVTELKVKILSILEQDGLDLIALNAALYAADKNDRIATLRMELRDRRANQIIRTYAVVKGVVVAVNPIGYVDVLGGVVVDGTMVMMLAKIYQLDMSLEKAKELAKAILKSAGWITLGELTGAAFKLLSFSWSTPLTLLPQAASAAFSSYVVGQAAKYYLEHGASWGGEGPKVVIRRILNNINKQSVIENFKEDIKKKLLLNPHAKQPHAK